MAQWFSLPSLGKKTRWGTLGLGPLVRTLAFLVFTSILFYYYFFKKLCFNISPSRIRVFIDLTKVSSSDVFVDKNRVIPRLSFVNVPGLNKVLRSKIFISDDKQLQVAHLILEYKPLSRIF